MITAVTRKCEICKLLLIPMLGIHRTYISDFRLAVAYFWVWAKRRTLSFFIFSVILFNCTYCCQQQHQYKATKCHRHKAKQSAKQASHGLSVVFSGAAPAARFTSFSIHQIPNPQITAACSTPSNVSTSPPLLARRPPTRSERRRQWSEMPIYYCMNIQSCKILERIGGQNFRRFLWWVLVDRRAMARRRIRVSSLH